MTDTTRQRQIAYEDGYGMVQSHEVQVLLHALAIGMEPGPFTVAQAEHVLRWAAKTFVDNAMLAAILDGTFVVMVNAHNQLVMRPTPPAPVPAPAAAPPRSIVSTERAARYAPVPVPTPVFPLKWAATPTAAPPAAPPADPAARPLRPRLPSTGPPHRPGRRGPRSVASPPPGAAAASAPPAAAGHNGRSRLLDRLGPRAAAALLAQQAAAAAPPTVRDVVPVAPAAQAAARPASPAGSAQAAPPPPAPAPSERRTSWPQLHSTGDLLRRGVCDDCGREVTLPFVREGKARCPACHNRWLDQQRQALGVVPELS